MAVIGRLGDVTCKPYHTGQLNSVTHSRVRFYDKKKKKVSGLVPATVKQRLKLLLLIITKTMGLVIGDRVKVLAHTAN